MRRTPVVQFPIERGDLVFILEHDTLSKTESSPTQVKDWPSKTALCLQTQQSLLGINGSRIGKLAARLANLIQVPNQGRRENPVATNRDEVDLEQEFESFHREVYSIAKPKKRIRKSKEQLRSSVPTEASVDEKIEQSEVTELSSNQHIECTNDEMTETWTNALRTNGNQAEMEDGWQSVEKGCTCNSSLLSEDLESVCSYSDTVRKIGARKGRPPLVCSEDVDVVSGNSRRRKKGNQIQNSGETYPITDTTAPKCVDELLDKFLLLEDVKSRTRVTSSRSQKNPRFQESKRNDTVQYLTPKLEDSCRPCYTRDGMIARLRYMYSKNIAGQFSFDMSEDVHTCNVPLKNKYNALKPISAVKKKTTRRLKLRLYLPT